MKFSNNLVQEKTHGISIKDSQPSVVFARAIQISTRILKTESVDRRNHESVDYQDITFEFEIDKKKHTARQVFRSGDVTPRLGQWVRAVVVQNQWFSTSITMTHLMKPKDEK